MPSRDAAAMRDEAHAFLSRHPDIEVFELLIPDTNGVPRGKWVPRNALAKVADGGIRLPSSMFALDIWGNDVLDSGLVFETGDRDALCLPVAGSLKEVPWLKRRTAQLLMSMYEPDGQPFFGDPRHILGRMVDLYRAMGLTPVTAIELEFYLLDREPGADGRPQPPLSPMTGRRQFTTQVYGIDELHEFEDFFDGISRAATLQDLPVDTTVAEQAPNQYEINLRHVADPVAAADHAMLLKRVIKGVAQAQGINATFMAKPYGDLAGNGMHVHFSLIDEHDHNVFDDGSAQGSALLRHAVAGLAATMGEAMPLFAPNINSYRRFQSGSHAPSNPSWGYDNRSTSLRIPSGERHAMRIEHRLSGADANPYLALAALLAGAYHGIVNQLEPDAPTIGNAHEQHAPTLHDNLADALIDFEESDFVAQYFGDAYRRLYAACKWQELATFGTQVTPLEYDSYLRTV
ncbi:glutamate--putrescine ligase [Plasticicumulans lactativorans]|uniref:Glutamate--putrescine ligase n=1 Tax=Plasticicumulans lactativorans TaxID=1133106 RepID=A0A4R2LCZ7_9GAMM|nr:glutamine synthetase family protein [Plasticicumulans lactativorans]TCO83475.1 glutamate--putrescine ligase [Plasticicumulans lactativorans]